MNLEVAKSGTVLCQKQGAVVSQLVPKLKESVLLGQKCPPHRFVEIKG